MVPKQHRLAILGAAGGIITLGAAVLGGKVMAQTPGSAASPTPNAAQQQHRAQADQALNDLAKNLGVDRAKLDSALKQTAKDEVSKAVQAGTLTQAEADKLNQAIDAGNGPLDLHFGGGFAGKFESDFGHGAGPDQVTGLKDALDKAFQQTVGETQDQFRQELQSGKTPDQVFAAHNTTAGAVGQAQVNAAKPILDQAVQAKTITQAQATEILQRLQNGPAGKGGPCGPGGPEGSGDHGGHHGAGGPGASGRASGIGKAAPRSTPAVQ